MDDLIAGDKASAQKDSSQNNKKRELWIDVAKGLGIIAVVVGHTGVPIARYLYWFHMPLFFIISGYLFKPPVDWSSFRSQTINRTRQLLIPYFTFLLLLSVFQHLHHRFPGGLNVLAGGRFVGGDFSVFWFITCLYVTQIAFAAIHIKIHDRQRRGTED